MAALALGSAALPGEAAGLECVGYFEFAESIVLAEVTSVRSTTPAWMFWRPREWAGMARVVKVLEGERKVPSSFAFSGSSERNECRAPDERSKVGRRFVFGIQRNDHYFDPNSSTGYVKKRAWKGDWISSEYDSVSSYNESRRPSG